MPLWTKVNNKIICLISPEYEKTYQYQPECYSPKELKDIFNAFLKMLIFAPEEQKLKDSYMLPSQVLRLLSQPPGIKLIETMNKVSVQLPTPGKITVFSNKFYGVKTVGDDPIPGRAKSFAEDHIYKVDRGVPSNHVCFAMIFSNDREFSHYENPNFIWCLPPDDGSSRTIQMCYAPLFIVIGHELRHLLSHFKGKAIGRLNFPASAVIDKNEVRLKEIRGQMAKLVASSDEYYELIEEDELLRQKKIIDPRNNWFFGKDHNQWRDVEEYRAINYANYCENVMRRAFGLPSRTSHLSEPLEIMFRDVEDPRNKHMVHSWQLNLSSKYPEFEIEKCASVPQSLAVPLLASVL